MRKRLKYLIPGKWNGIILYMMGLSSMMMAMSLHKRCAHCIDCKNNIENFHFRKMWCAEPSFHSSLAQTFCQPLNCPNFIQFLSLSSCSAPLKINHFSYPFKTLFKYHKNRINGLKMVRFMYKRANVGGVGRQAPDYAITKLQLRFVRQINVQILK